LSHSASTWNFCHALNLFARKRFVLWRAQTHPR
jgi:hypothetical protein